MREAPLAEIPRHVEPAIPVLKRLRVIALRDDDVETFDDVQRTARDLRAVVSLSEARWHDGRLHLAATAVLSAAGEEVRLLRDEAGLVLDRLRPVDPDSRRLTDTDRGALELTVRHRDSGVERPLPGESAVHELESADGVGLEVRWAGVIDPWNGCFGQSLDDGVWDVLVRSQFLGESRVHRLAVAQVPDDETSSADGRRRAHAALTQRGTLALRVTASRPERPRATRAEWDGATLRLTFARPFDGDLQLVAQVRGSADAVTSTAPAGATAVSIALPDTSAGDVVDFWLLTDGDQRMRVVHDVSSGVPHQAPYTVYRTQHGSLSVRHEAAPAPPAEPPGVRGRMGALARRLRSGGR